MFYILRATTSRRVRNRVGVKPGQVELSLKLEIHLFWQENHTLWYGKCQLSEENRVI